MAEVNPEKLVAPTSPVRESTPGLPASKAPSVSPNAAYPAFRFPSHLPQPPFVDVDGVANFRELGGYLCTPYGGTRPTHIMRRSILYRCAHPSQITPEGGETLRNSLGVRAVYDLRSAPEVVRSNAATQAEAGGNNGMPGSVDPFTAAKEPATIGGVTRHFTPVYTAEDYGPEALARKLKWYKEDSSSSGPDEPSSLGPYSEGFVSAYRDISLHGANAYGKILRHILQTPAEPLVFHCTAGKDRTGVLGALLMRLAGVDDETICWEYAITEPGLGKWRDLFIERMTTQGMDSGDSKERKATTPTGNKVDPVTRAEAARIAGSRGGNMRAYLKLILDGEFGGVETYLEGCGFTHDEIETLRKNIVTPLEEAGEHRVVRPVDIAHWTVDGGMEHTSNEPLPLDTSAGPEKEQKVMAG